MMAEKNNSGIKIVGTIEGEVPESMKSRSPDDEVQFAWRSDKDLDCPQKVTWEQIAMNNGAVRTTGCVARVNAVRSC